MNDKTLNRRTLLPRLPEGAAGSIMSALFALTAVALVSLGVGLIFMPAGVITAGLGFALLQWQFFGGQ
jgi:hypothetical protein